MNEKHDALYSSARVVLNSNIKRLWFNVNPFLEKKVALNARPEPPSKFIQPLQSTLVCEKYLQDESCDQKDLQIEDFWDYLYAGDYSGGFSVRVLEGQLLEYIMTSLNVLQKSGKVVSHTTFAFARNERERRGCYKLANQRGCGIIKETLLIEFTYFGRYIKPLKSQPSTFSSYPETTTASDIPYIESSILESEDEIYSGQTLLEEVIIPSETSNDRCLKQSCLSLGGNIKDKQVKKPATDRIKISKNETGRKFRKIPRQESLIQSDDSSYASTESDYRLKFAKPNLEKFHCTEKIKYPDESAEDTEEESSEEENYGEEFYLSDVIRKGFSNGESVGENLRKRNENRIKEREEIGRFVKDWSQSHKRKDSDHKLLSEDKVVDADLQLRFNFLTKVPTLEEFICILEEFEKFDPRYKKQKQLAKKVARQYNLEKTSKFGNSHMVTALVQNSPDTQRQKKGKSLTKLPHARPRRLSTFAKISQLILSPRKQDSSPVIDDQATAKIVGGITDSKPCEDFVADQMGRPRRMSVGGEPGKSRRMSLPRLQKRRQSLAIRPTGTLVEEEEEMKFPSIILTSPSGTSTRIQVSSSNESVKLQTSPKFKSSRAKSPKVVPVLPAESPSEETEEEKFVDEPVSLFDTSKLNVRYSFEKLRGKGYHKKKPAFYNVLKKYYRMHSAVTAFNEPVVEKGKRRKSILERIIDTKKAKVSRPKRKMIIGKLMQYKFQAYQKTRTVHVETAEFKYICMDEFREKLFKALDDFVVKQERVVSSYGSKISTTITFTKKTVFQKK